MPCEGTVIEANFHIFLILCCCFFSGELNHATALMYDDDCDTYADQCDSTVGLQCKMQFAECQYGLCKCPGGQAWDMSSMRCKTAVLPTKSCGAADACTGFSTCQTSLCTCGPLTVYNTVSGQCDFRGFPCNQTSDCMYVFGLICDNGGECNCPPNMQLEYGGSCIAALHDKQEGSPCNNTLDCVDTDLKCDRCPSINNTSVQKRCHRPYANAGGDAGSTDGTSASDGGEASSTDGTSASVGVDLSSTDGAATEVTNSNTNVSTVSSSPLSGQSSGRMPELSTGIILASMIVFQVLS